MKTFLTFSYSLRGDGGGMDALLSPTNTGVVLVTKIFAPLLSPLKRLLINLPAIDMNPYKSGSDTLSTGESGTARYRGQSNTGVADSSSIYPVSLFYYLPPFSNSLKIRFMRSSIMNRIRTGCGSNLKVKL